MPDIDTALQDTRPVGFYNLLDEPPLYYVNAWQVKVTNSEVTILLGNVIEDNPQQQIIRKSSSIVLSHESFSRLVESFHQSLDIVKLMYGGQIPVHAQLTPEQIGEIEERFPNSKVTNG